MRIIQTPARFHPFIGGVENYVYNLSQVLTELGHDVKVICANEPEGRTNDSIKGIKIRRLQYIGKIANTNITPGLPSALLGEDFDIIHAHLPTPWSADWSAIVAKAKGRPLVLTYHNDIVGKGFESRVAGLYNLTGLQLLLKAASMIIITQPNYIESSNYLKSYKNKAQIVPIGVDIDRFRPEGKGESEPEPKGCKVLFFLGVLDKFHRYKGLDYLLQAMAMVKEQKPNVKLVVGGSGELQGHYADLAVRLGLSRNVEFPGSISEEELPECYNHCDAFILPSVSSDQEGFGIVLLEAMACAKPVISTEIVGVAEDVKRFDAGRIVQPRDAGALARAILEILGNKEEADEMGQRGRRLVEEKYTWKKVGRDVLRIYEELM